MAIYTVDDVFGVSRDVPLNYVERDDVDGIFIDSLSRKQHIVIHGSSKQGKTCLRKRCLSSEDSIVVSCQNGWKLAELHSAILKQAGYEIALSKSLTVSGNHKISATIGAKLKAFIFTEANTSGAYEYQKQNIEKIEKEGLELDPNDPNDVIRALDEISFKKFIAIEDFHYLPDETQRSFSFALKALHEQSDLCCIITGVWREQNRLIAFNGDLTERVFSVDADSWKDDDLHRVINSGESLLNIKIDEDFKGALIAGSNNSVHIVQEACRQLCRKYSVVRTEKTPKIIGSRVDAEEILKKIVDAQGGRYHGFLINFSEGFQKTELEMQKWLIFVILTSAADELTRGLRLLDVSRKMKAKHPKGEDLNNGNITQALNSVTSLQSLKGVRPIIIDYDATNRNLNVVDRGFLIWLEHQDRRELLGELSLPVN